MRGFFFRDIHFQVTNLEDILFLHSIRSRTPSFEFLVIFDFLHKRTVESGKNVTFFEQLFCFYQLVLVVWNTFGAKFIIVFYFLSETELALFVAMEEKIALPHLGGLLGETGVREKSFLRSRVQ